MYGSTLEVANRLRGPNGFLDVRPFRDFSNDEVLPPDDETFCRSVRRETEPCFLAGDVRSNENHGKRYYSRWLSPTNNTAPMFHWIVNPDFVNGSLKANKHQQHTTVPPKGLWWSRRDCKKQGVQDPQQNFGVQVVPAREPMNRWKILSLVISLTFSFLSNGTLFWHRVLQFHFKGFNKSSFQRYHLIIWVILFIGSSDHDARCMGSRAQSYS